jgi:hypothetical protein
MGFSMPPILRRKNCAKEIITSVKSSEAIFKTHYGSLVNPVTLFSIKMRQRLEVSGLYIFGG